MNNILRCAALLMMISTSACLEEPVAPEASETSSPESPEIFSSVKAIDANPYGVQGKGDDVTVQCEPFCCEWDYNLDQCRWWAGCLPGGMISYCP